MPEKEGLPLALCGLCVLQPLGSPPDLCSRSLSEAGSASCRGPGSREKGVRKPGWREEPSPGLALVLSPDSAEGPGWGPFPVTVCLPDGSLAFSFGLSRGVRGLCGEPSQCHLLHHPPIS